MSYALELRGIVKRFPGVLANDRIDLAVEAGEIRALVGENGAGKTTLMRVAYGLYQPEAGEIRVGGRRRRFRSPADAIRAGLGMVHQHFMLFPSLSVAENVVFGAEPRRRGLLDRRQAVEQVEALSERYGLEVDPRARVAALPVGVRQRVEILKTLYRDAGILILDEPTAVLTPQERDGLFAVLRRLADQGRSIIFITHKLPEVLSISDRATVMRDGTVTGTVPTAETTAEEICRLMVGREVELRVEKTARAPGGRLLSVEGLWVAGAHGRAAVRGVDFEVRQGEIVAIAGAAGNGQTELVESIAGLRPIAAGRLQLAGHDVTELTVRGRRQAGQSHIPEDRDGVGLALEATAAECLIMGFHRRPPMCRRGLLSRRAIGRHARGLLTDFAVKGATPGQRAGTLSGGNRQRLVVGRELRLCDRLLIAEQPTRGVDIAATEFVHRRLVDHRDEGRGILLVSTELTEVLGLADRILVMYEGRIVGEVESAEATEAELGLLMAGGRESGEQA